MDATENDDVSDDAGNFGANPYGDFKMPEKDELLKMIEGLSMSEDERDNLRRAILGEEQPEPEPYQDPGININAERLVTFFALMVFLYVLGTLLRIILKIPPGGL
jgi:hypothetical protein